MLTVGSVPPPFKVRGSDGRDHTLGDYAGRYLLLYFYPKDDTTGCTMEACRFRNRWNDLQDAQCDILGISKDPIASHKEFSKKCKLQFPLLSDESGAMIEAYGAWQEKSVYGKVFMGIARISYLIGPDGIVAKVYDHVKPEDHARDVLKDVLALRELKNT